jgi:hypothetical protein
MRTRLLAAACAAALVATSVSAPVAAKPASLVPEAMIKDQRQRSVRVLVAQSEIKSNINGSQLGTAIMVAAGGGLLAGLVGGLITAAQNAEREKQAEALIAPLRTSLADFDADRLAQDSAQASLTNVAWLKGAPTSFGKDSSPLGKSDYLNTAADQVVFVEYSYDLSPEFDSVRVIETVQVANKALPALRKGLTAKPQDRITRYLAYSHTITSAVLLPDADPKNKKANAERWAANGGELARRGVAQAFARLVDLTPRALALTQAEVKTMKDSKRPRAAYGGLSGRLVSRDDKGTLIWANQFIAVQPLAAVPIAVPAPVQAAAPAEPTAPTEGSTPAAQPATPVAAQPVAALAQ